MHKLFFSKNSVNLSNVIFPYLIGIFPVLFIFNYNKEELSIHDLVLPVLVTLFSIKILMLLLIKIFKDVKKAGLFLLFLIATFFFYDNIFDFLIPYRDWPPLRHLNQFLAIAIIITFFLSFILIRKSKISLILVKFLNIVGIYLLFFNLIEISIYKIIKRDLFKNNYQVDEYENNVKKPAVFTQNNKGARDIYFIILDGYPSSKVLMEFYHYNNKYFIDMLKSKGFFIAENSRANYSATFLSLASSLNMMYLNHLEKGIENINNFKDRKVPYEMIKNNRLVSNLKTYGYKYVHFKSTWGATDHNPNADIYLSGPNSLLLSKFNTEFNMVILKSTILREWLKKNNYFNLYSDQILFNLDKISDLNGIQGPKFIFAHIMSPHPPYVFDEFGKSPKVVNMNYFGNEWNRKDAFIDQLKFVNKKIILAVNKILINSEIEPIIVIQADHGTCSTCDSSNENIINNYEVSEETLRERLNILNAMYLPEGGSKLLYDEISPVNTFRCILKFYFDKGFKLLEDKHYYSSYESPYKFLDVTGNGIFE